MKGSLYHSCGDVIILDNFLKRYLRRLLDVSLKKRINEDEVMDSAIYRAAFSLIFPVIGIYAIYKFYREMKDMKTAMSMYFLNGDKVVTLFRGVKWLVAFPALLASVLSVIYYGTNISVIMWMFVALYTLSFYALTLILLFITRINLAPQEV